MPIATSATPWRGVRPLTVHTIVPGESSVPTDRNHSAPWARMPGTFASVSTLFASVGGASVRSPGAAISIFAAEVTRSAPNSSAPWRYGGETRGNGPRPSIASSSPVSSPYRYSGGPSNTLSSTSVAHPAAWIS
jgi:hypothetical protein